MFYKKSSDYETVSNDEEINSGIKIFKKHL